MKKSKTALVTGASAGIGREFARQLAPQCDRMILVGRREARLASLADELESDRVECTLLSVDLVEQAGVEQVVDAIRDAGPLEYLVNNAGFTIIGAFETIPLSKQLTMVQVHINATITLTHAALPAMKAARRGAIINLSSMCTFTPYPDVAVYGGSKAFLTNFTAALGMELKGSGVSVQCLVPGFTHTELHDREAFDNYVTPEIPAEMWMEPRDVVLESLAAFEGDRALVVAGRVNRTAAREALLRDMEAMQS
ncbi:MAG: SDR family oxidoreductase [Gammaproteobacteria bacterium]|nr:SDR family oxidoreductase [Gammaproteobacteria bacterium]